MLHETALTVCPYCHATYLVPAALLGTGVTCKQCRAPFAVAAAGANPAAWPPAPPASDVAREEPRPFRPPPPASTFVPVYIDPDRGLAPSGAASRLSRRFGVAVAVVGLLTAAGALVAVNAWRVSTARVEKAAPVKATPAGPGRAKSTAGTAR